MQPQLSETGAAITPVHLVLPGLGGGTACMPHIRKMKRLPQHTMMQTDDPQAVTCAACKRAQNIAAPVAHPDGD